MISFGQILILIFIALLLFGDLRKIFNQFLLILINMKTLFQKTLEDKSSSKKSDKKE